MKKELNLKDTIQLDEKQKIIDVISHPEHRKRVSIIKTQIVRDGSMLYGTRRFRTPAEAAGMVKELYQFADREMMTVLSLDTKNAPLALEIIAVGTLNSCPVQMREVFKHSILSNAASIIVFHNHPSGMPTPSGEDYRITERMDEAGKLLGIWLLDHIIIGSGDEYFSMQENGYVKNGYIKIA